MQPLCDNARVLSASRVGTTIEFYDFFIYATAALVFGPLFFPVPSAAAQMPSVAGAAQYTGRLLAAAGLLTVVVLKLFRPVDPLD